MIALKVSEREFVTITGKNNDSSEMHMSPSVYISVKMLPVMIFSGSPLNTDIQLIQTLCHVFLVSVLTGLHFIHQAQNSPSYFYHCA